VPVGRVARIGAQILDALAAAHRAGVIHRDLKPGNIVVTRAEDGADVAKLVDFGAAKVLSGSQGAITSTGTLIGTLSYMSPEQAQVLELDGRADVYATSVCMYTACVGKNPFVRESPDETVKAILGGRAVPLSKARPDLDPAFCAIVERGMARQRDARYATAAEMSEALEAWLAADLARPASEPSRAAPSGQLALLIVAGIFLGGLAAAALLGASVERARAPEPATSPASAVVAP
jgi:serine/threonine-protein kinase